MKTSNFDDSIEGILSSIRRGNTKHIEHALNRVEYIPREYFNIHAAAESGEVKILNMLLSSEKLNLDVNAKNTCDLTCLAIATWRNRSNVVRYLCSMRNAIDLNKRVTAADNTALHIAALYNFVDIVLILLRAGAEKTIENYYGRTAEQEALNRGNHEIANIIAKFENNLAMKLKLKRQILDQDSYSDYHLSDITIKISQSLE